MDVILYEIVDKMNEPIVQAKYNEASSAITNIEYPKKPKGIEPKNKKSFREKLAGFIIDRVNLENQNEAIIRSGLEGLAENIENCSNIEHMEVQSQGQTVDDDNDSNSLLGHKDTANDLSNDTSTEKDDKDEETRGLVF